jgi:hypothetical protein
MPNAMMRRRSTSPLFLTFPIVASRKRCPNCAKIVFERYVINLKRRSRRTNIEVMTDQLQPVVLDRPLDVSDQECSRRSSSELPVPSFSDPKHSINFYQGDCLELLPCIPENSVDVVFAGCPILSPPLRKGGRNSYQCTTRYRPLLSSNERNPKSRKTCSCCRIFGFTFLLPGWRA